MINFKDMLLHYKSRTEKTATSTYKITDDAMFINGKSIVTLEYVLYQNSSDAVYSNLVEVKVPVIDDSTGHHTRRKNNRTCYEDTPKKMYDA